MSSSPSRNTLVAAALPLTALNIGLWEDDTGADCVRGDGVMARLFGLPEDEAAAGITWERLRSIFHPEDLLRDTAERRRVRAEGGPFAWEHRIVPEPGVVRWILARGRFDKDAAGRVRGRGIVIDVTDSRMDGAIDGLGRFMTARVIPTGSPLEDIAEQALDLWQRVQTLDAVSAGRVRPLVQALLCEAGQLLAAAPVRVTDRSSDPRTH